MRVFVDTSGVLALIWPKDRRHADAVAAWGRLRAREAQLITTDWVIAEAVTLARARASFDLSALMAERLLSPAFELEWVDRRLLTEALDLYRKYRDHVLSLCDCVSFAVMKRRKLTTAFAYDEDFRRVGFETL